MSLHHGFGKLNFTRSHQIITCTSICHLPPFYRHFNTLYIISFDLKSQGIWVEYFRLLSKQFSSTSRRKSPMKAGNHFLSTTKYCIMKIEVKCMLANWHEFFRSCSILSTMKYFHLFLPKPNSFLYFYKNETIWFLRNSTCEVFMKYLNDKLDCKYIYNILRQCSSSSSIRFICV
jgi:hypothetical protein